jgi:hypothetical protein
VGQDLENLRMWAREHMEREASPAAANNDSQSVKSEEKRAIITA